MVKARSKEKHYSYGNTMLDHINPWMLWPVTFLGITFGLIYVYITWNFNYWKKRDVPTQKPRFPFGNFTDIFTISRSSQEFYRDLYDRFAGQRYAGCVTFNEVILLPRDPELIKSILVKDFSHFHDRGMASSEDYDAMSMNLFSLNGKRWNVLRSKLAPTFTSGKMKGMFPLVRKCAEELRETIQRNMDKGGNDIEFKDLLARYTTDAIASVAFGVEGGSLADPNAEFRVNGRRVFDMSFPNSLRMGAVLIVPYLCAKLGIQMFNPTAVKYFTKMVHQTLDYREKNGVKRSDFLQLLMGLKKDDSGKNSSEVNMTKAVIEAQCFIFFVAGFETSSSAVSFCIYELAQNLDIQEQVRSEIDRVLRSHGEEITYESLAEMQLMDRVLNETMRKYPAVPVLFRECTKPFVIPPAPGMAPNGKEWRPETVNGGTVIEVGTRIQVPIVGLHYDSDYFPDPERFDPNRFTEEAIKSRPAYVYMPFGEGPRICIGMRYGVMQAKAALANLLLHFEFRPSKKTTYPLVLDKRAFFPASKDGIWIKALKRT